MPGEKDELQHTKTEAAFEDAPPAAAAEDDSDPDFDDLDGEMRAVPVELCN